MNLSVKKFLSKVAATAIVSSRPWLLRKLRPLWDASLVPLGALHVVGNAEACRMLLQAGGRFAVNNTQDWHGAGVTPLYCAQSMEVASCLLEARADVAQVLACSERLPRLDVIRWIFELCSAERVWHVAWPAHAFFAKQRGDSMLSVVGLLAEFGSCAGQ